MVKSTGPRNCACEAEYIRTKLAGNKVAEDAATTSEPPSNSPSMKDQAAAVDVTCKSETPCPPPLVKCQVAADDVKSTSEMSEATKLQPESIASDDKSQSQANQRQCPAGAQSNQTPLCGQCSRSIQSDQTQLQPDPIDPDDWWNRSRPIQRGQCPGITRTQLQPNPIDPDNWHARSQVVHCGGCKSVQGPPDQARPMQLQPDPIDPDDWWNRSRPIQRDQSPRGLKSDQFCFSPPAFQDSNSGSMQLQPDPIDPDDWWNRSNSLQQSGRQEQASDCPGPKCYPPNYRNAGY